MVVVACTTKENFSAKQDVHVPIASPTSDPQRFIDFRVGNVRLGDSEKQVLKELGKPRTRRTVTEDNCGISEVLKLKYPGLEVQLDKDLEGEWGVLEMIVTSNDISIEPQVKIGEELETIKSRFENPHIVGANSDAPVLYYLTRNNDNAQFEFKDNKISKVRFYINPC
jgi:hypothetical protein